jgi:hypothetical protein
LQVVWGIPLFRADAIDDVQAETAIALELRLVEELIRCRLLRK